MTRFAPLPVTLTALGLAACSMAGAATIQAGSPLARAPEGLRCALIVRESGGQVAVEARLAAHEAVTGRYALTIRQQSAGGSSDIRQGGDFSAGQGQDMVLGQAQLAGRASDLAAAFTIDVAGRTIDCPAAPRL